MARFFALLGEAATLARFFKCGVVGGSRLGAGGVAASVGAGTDSAETVGGGTDGAGTVGAETVGRGTDSAGGDGARANVVGTEGEEAVSARGERGKRALAGADSTATEGDRTDGARTGVIRPDSSLAGRKDRLEVDRA